MKFLIATGIYPPDVGGPATVMADLAARLRAAGHTVDIVTYGDASTESEVHRVSRRGSVPVRYWKFFRAVRSRLDSDATLLATDVFSVGIPSRFALIGKKNRFLIRLGGEWCWEDAVTNRGYRGKIHEFWNRNDDPRRRAMKMVYRWILERASSIAVSSELLREVVGVIVPSRKGSMTVVPNVTRVQADVRRPASGPHDPLRLIYVGRFAPVKNLPFFARALLKAHRHGVKFACDFFGDGPELRETQAILKDVSHVTFHGSVSRQVVLQRMAEADLLVLPSLSDMYPNTVVEALASGLPCLITTAHGMGERHLPGTEVCDPTDMKQWIDAIQKYTAPVEYERLRSAVGSLPTSGVTLESFVYGNA